MTCFKPFENNNWVQMNKNSNEQVLRTDWPIFHLPWDKVAASKIEFKTFDKIAL